MTEFDRKIKELSKNIEMPEDYDKRVEEILETLPEKEPVRHQRKRTGRKIAVLAVCSLCIIIFLNVGEAMKADANIFEAFKTTILDFLAGDSENAGVDSNKTSVASKPDLRMELQEMVVSSHEIYLLVRITAPPDINFNQNVSFEYFAFSTGENFNTDDLLSGSRDCELVEVMEGKPNIAIFAVSLATDEALENGSQITAYFENLAEDPYSDHPTLLVEGIWSLKFQADFTVRDEITQEATEEMTFPFLNTTAKVESVEINPLGLVLKADVSEVPQDELGISDTTIPLRLKLTDGSEIVLISRDPEEETMVQGGSCAFDTVGDKTIETVMCEFSEVIDINQIEGVYIEDLFWPVN